MWSQTIFDEAKLEFFDLVRDLVGDLTHWFSRLSDLERLVGLAAFILMLFLTAATGLALAGLRATPAMGIMLCLHLGVVAALFLSLPYGKFVHVFSRFSALIRAHAEARH